MRGFLYLLALGGSSWCSVLFSEQAARLGAWLRIRPSVRRWSPALGMVLATAAYLIAPTSGDEKWALVAAGMNAIAIGYIGIRHLVRSRNFSQDRLRYQTNRPGLSLVPIP